MDIFTKFEIGSKVEKDGKPYLIVGTAGINGYLVVSKDADPNELADVKFIQVSWVGGSEESKFSPERINTI